MKNLRLLNVDKDHSYISEDAFVAESWIIQKGDPTFPDDPAGSWAVGIIVQDDETWDQVQKGEIEAISMGGTGDKVLDVDLNKKDDPLVIDESIIKKIVKKTVKKILKKGGEDMEEKEVQKLIDDAIAPIKKAVDEMPKPLTTDEMTVIVKEAVKPLTERVDKVEKTSKGSNQDDDEIKTDEDLEKIGAAIAKAVNEG